ncbi:hypothetical protein PLICRDRAFT_176198 [Plicaturopsis crispa FD-325 SS-3]|nr:hypothetical protein PLICRDRAFT_176198 [Plicaturopsis crispa FD-325 SS-3]
MAHGRVVNFGAGPSALPLPVLEEASKGLLNFNGTGIGIAEISHRGKDFAAFLAQTESNIRTMLDVPSTHRILFTQGGGSLQFDAVVYNLLARHRLLHPEPDHERVVDYCVTGSWSKKAMEEARRLGGSRVNIAVDARPYSKDAKSFDNIPAHEHYAFSDDPALIYYCANETVDGVEYAHEDDSPASFPFHRLPKGTLLPLVADYSSSFMARPIPHLGEHAIIYAGAQKNIGPAGVTIVIVREDCMVDVDAAAKLGAAAVPATLAYKTIADNKSLYNTPSVLSLYISGLVLEHMKKLGGLPYYEALNKRKAEKVYAVVKEGEAKGILQRKVQDGSGSSVNVTFGLLGDGLQEKFLKDADAQGLKALAGHRSVGGIRVSLYNAVTEEDTDKLVAFIKEFIANAEAAKSSDAQ